MNKEYYYVITDSASIDPILILGVFDKQCLNDLFKIDVDMITWNENGDGSYYGVCVIDNYYNYKNVQTCEEQFTIQKFNLNASYTYMNS